MVTSPTYTNGATMPKESRYSWIRVTFAAADGLGANRTVIIPPEQYDQRAHATSAAPRITAHQEVARPASRDGRPDAGDFPARPLESVGGIGSCV
jgi:hypothetical protein